MRSAAAAEQVARPTRVDHQCLSRHCNSRSHCMRRFMSRSLFLRAVLAALAMILALAPTAGAAAATLDAEPTEAPSDEVAATESATEAAAGTAVPAEDDDRAPVEDDA